MKTQTETDLMPEFNAQPMPLNQQAQMALTLAALFCSQRGLPLQTDEGKPSQQVAAVAAALLS